MNMPKNAKGRWWGEIFKNADVGDHVIIAQFWDCTEVLLKDREGKHPMIACFRSMKHALEFCKINKLVVDE